MILSETCCVVTGAARGIGFELASGLHAAGARVVLNDVDPEAVRSAAVRLGPERVLAVPGDITRAADVATLAREAGAAFGPVTVWINNAGLARHRPIVDYPEAEIDLMLAVNLKGTILGSQAALRVMAPQRRGHIVNIISTASLRGVPTETVYCAAKWGARGFTQGLREEAAPHGVRVTALLPGGVDTGFWNDAVSGRNLPRENWLRASDVAGAVLALLQMPDHVVPQELVLRAMHDRDFAS
ncbi:MAG: putative oxidoreductase [Rariglobus sp.]|jgi:NAD(P)-dependent dehydrogenase (short-subunit alcohol dehydrogenase family)|nr:putative oxidoreductase [Rariglobus sp.]